MYRSGSDLGIVAAQLAEEASQDLAAEATPPVRIVFERLHAIAETSGSCSAARKVALLAEVLTPLDPASAAFMSRFPLGTLRLGIGDPSILDS
jgi:DNA ligase-1